MYEDLIQDPFVNSATHSKVCNTSACVPPVQPLAPALTLLPNLIYLQHHRCRPLSLWCPVSHREVTALLQRKSSWVPADVARFTELYAAEHQTEQAVAEAKSRSG